MASTEKSSIYMLNLSDGALRNEITNKKLLQFNLKMNLLFFDELFVSAPALLRNHVLFDMSKSPEQKEALGEIYSKHIRPILIEGNKDIITVAENVIKSDKPIGLSDLKREKDLSHIMTHAEFIKDPKHEPVYFNVPKTDFRKEYYDVYQILVNKYNDNGVTFWSNQFSKNILLEFLDKLENIDKETFRVTDAYALADKYTSGPLQKFLKTLAFTTMEYFTAPHEEVSGYSLNRLNTPIINDYYETVWDESLSISDLPPEGSTGEKKNPPLPLPLDRIIDVSFSEILKLRQTDLFIKIRERLHSCKLGNIKNIPDDILKIYNETIEQFERFIAHSDIRDRKKILNEIKNKKKQLWINNIGQAAVAFGVSLPLVMADPKSLIPYITFILTYGGAKAVSMHVQFRSDDNVYGSFKKITDEERNVVYGPWTGNTTLS